MSLLTDIRTNEHDNAHDTSPSTPEPAHADLARLLDEVAQRVVAHGTRTEAPVLEAMATAAHEARPGAASALVDWDGSEVARLRAFGVVHGVVLGLGADAGSALLDRVRGRGDRALLR